MKCPICNFQDSRVLDSRPVEDGTSIKRRRECVSCGKRFTTYEKLETISIVVIKKDGSSQAYDRDKVIAGLVHACEKRPVSMDMIEKAVSEIETTLQNSLDREVTSVHIGELVMDKLKGIDQVAYVRFASVYKQFKDVNAFMEELSSFLDKK